MSHTWEIEIPTPLIQVVASEHWKSGAVRGYGGYNEFEVVISIGDVELVRRTGDDNEPDDWGHYLSLDELRERTVKEFGERLKEVLGL
ncbi:hypothetical protein EV284_3510 [Streptomyces sp. BK022]|uniref:hypothetical protein n=1 Tax=Streptomyces sp. BK022 TaxID=2512123 RepID=UPI001028DBA8|nr:hypothetical protein [Streptomyces sp. BK022]RZU36027.1 hypothetical protein EV284_3510 [Streptomyces sp. BK022]